jgi:hypothetical protein
MNRPDLAWLGRGVKRIALAPVQGAALPRPLAWPVLRPVDGAQVLRRLDAWLCLSRITQRRWSERLPAVGAASLMLTAYASFSGANPVDVRWAIGLGLAAAALGLHTDSE